MADTTGVITMATLAVLVMISLIVSEATIPETVLHLERMPSTPNHPLYHPFIGARDRLRHSRMWQQSADRAEGTIDFPLEGLGIFGLILLPILIFNWFTKLSFFFWIDKCLNNFWRDGYIYINIYLYPWHCYQLYGILPPVARTESNLISWIFIFVGCILLEWHWGLVGENSRWLSIPEVIFRGLHAAPAILALKLVKKG